MTILDLPAKEASVWPVTLGILYVVTSQPE